MPHFPEEGQLRAGAWLALTLIGALVAFGVVLPVIRGQSAEIDVGGAWLLVFVVVAIMVVGWFLHRSHRRSWP